MEKENLTKDTPPQNGFWTPFVSYVFQPSGVVALFFLYRNLRLSTPEALFEGSQSFPEGALSGALSSPDTFCTPPYHIMAQCFLLCIGFWVCSVFFGVCPLGSSAWSLKLCRAEALQSGLGLIVLSSVLGTSFFRHVVCCRMCLVTAFPLCRCMGYVGAVSARRSNVIVEYLGHQTYKSSL